MAEILHVRAWFLGSRIDVRELEQTRVLAQAPLTISAGRHGWAVVFRFGVVVLFGLSSVEEAETLRALSAFVVGKLDEPELETMEIIIDAGQPEQINTESRLVLADTGVSRLQMAAQALAKSAVLSHYEKAVAHTFERFEHLVEQLRQGLSPRRGRAVLNEIGNALSILIRTVGRVEVTEKPELTWDDPSLDRLYQRLAVEYELQDRDLALSRKLDLVWRMAETYLDLVNHRQGMRVEWYIVALILFEIVLTLTDKLHLWP
jgi:uncharacterized Rmd1/YagE family protein